MITFPSQSYTFLFFFSASVLHLLILWLSVSSQSPYIIPLIFCYVWSIFGLIYLVFMVIFCAAINRDRVFLFMCPFRNHCLCVLSPLDHFEDPLSCFSSHFCFYRFFVFLLVLMLLFMLLVAVIRLSFPLLMFRALTLMDQRNSQCLWVLLLFSWKRKNLPKSGLCRPDKPH